jgi:hypothetical protein
MPASAGAGAAIARAAPPAPGRELREGRRAGRGAPRGRQPGCLS